MTVCNRTLIFLLFSLGFYSSHAQHYVWGKSFASTSGLTSGNAIAVGADEKVYIAGVYNGIMSVEGNDLPDSGPGQQGFLVKLDPTGTVQWAKSLKASVAAELSFLHATRDGNLIAGGLFQGLIRFGTDSIVSGTRGSSFIVKYNTDGEAIWHMADSTITNTYLTVDAFDNIYATGWETLEGSQSNYRILKYDSKGKSVFDKRIYQGTNTSFFAASHLAVDNAGSIYISGLAAGNAVIGSIPFLQGSSNGTFVIVKCSKDGDPVRIKNTLDVPTGGAYWTGTIKVDGWGNLFYSALADRLFLAKYDSAGKSLWTIDKQNISLGASEIALNEDGTLITAGLVAGNFTLDNINFTNHGFYSTYVAQFDRNGKLSWAVQGQNEQLDYTLGLARSRMTSDLYVTGLLQSLNPTFGTINLPAPSQTRRAMALKVSFRSDFKPLSLNLGLDATLCEGQATTVTIPSGFASYRWQDGATESPRTIGTAGTYIVNASDLTGYIYTDTLNVVVNPAPKISLGKDTTLCAGNTLTLHAGAGFTSYQWQDFSLNEYFNVISPGKFSVTVRNQFGCFGQASVNIGYLTSPEVDLGRDALACSFFAPLSAINKNSKYFWSTGATDSVFTPATEGKYWVNVINQCGQASDTINIYTLENASFPNVVTLNGDGKNDKFRVLGIDVTFTIRIYNRWGTSIYNKSGYKDEWPIDNSLDTGVYYYLIKYPGCEQEIKGWINLIK